MLAKLRKSVRSAPSFALDRGLMLSATKPDHPERILWRTGISTEITLTLSGRHEGPAPKFIWLEWEGEEAADLVLESPASFSGFNGYDSDKECVVMSGHAISGFRGGKIAGDLYRFSAHLYFARLPKGPTEVLDGVSVRFAKFRVMVPGPGAEPEDLFDATRPPTILERGFVLPVQVSS